jgi:hypothetical protein
MCASANDLTTLHRYFIWANRMRTHFDDVLGRDARAPAETDADAKHRSQIETFLYMSYWYGGLYVVVEGWKELGLHDAKIDDLLASPNVDLLRRYRNGAFHFQRRYFDERFTDFMAGEDTAEWVRVLNRELGRFFLERFRSERQPRE